MTAVRSTTAPRWAARVASASFVVPALIALGGASAVGGLVALSGGSIPVALGGWWNGAFGTGYAVVQTLAYSVPLVIVALGAALALRAGVISVGAEGQMIVGAIVATSIAFLIGPGLGPVSLVIGALAGAAGGAAWAALAAAARVHWGVNEILFTLLSNYIAFALLAFVLRTVLRNPAQVATPQSAELPADFLLPMLPLPGRLSIAAILVVVLVALAARWHRSRASFVLGLVGEQPALASRLGLSEPRAVYATMIISGAAAGLAGWTQLAGVDERLQPAVSAGIGFAGLAVAVLGRFHPVGIVIAAIAYASLTTGSNGIQFATGTVPASIGTVSQGVLLLTAALVVATHQALRVRRERENAATGVPSAGGKNE